MIRIVESNENDQLESALTSFSPTQKIPLHEPPEIGSKDEKEHGNSDHVSTQVTSTSGSPKASNEQSLSQDAAARPLQEHAQDLEAQESTAQACLYSVFPLATKRYIVFMVAWAGFFSPLSGNIYYPALNTLSRDLNVSKELVNLTLTSYSIFQGLAPTIFGDLADMAGRRPAYIIGFVIYIAACVGIALQHSYPALFVLRCFQSTGSSATIALGNGVVADIATTAERGTWMGWATVGPMIGPAVGPLVGGILAQFLGWRSIFWFLAIIGSLYLIAFAITVPETGRNVVGNGSIAPQGWNMSLLNYLAVRKAAAASTTTGTNPHDARTALAQSRKLRWPNPLNTLRVLNEPDLRLLILLNSLIYTAFINVLASAPYLLSDTYAFNDLQIGLSFLPFGVGGFVAPVVNGYLLDANYARISRAMGRAVDRRREDDDDAMASFPLERARIEVAAPLLLLGLATLTAYGWTMHAEAALAAPLVLLFVLGVSLTGAFNVLNVLLVDLYPLAPATATAAQNLTRCLFSAAGSAVIIFLIKSMGRGWCFTFHALVILCVSPVLVALVRRGPRWRDQRRRREACRKGGEEPKEGEAKDG
ncbi:major facilitator superfamily domain-containing protein [Phyllosticta capitalensis]|uniref:Major facilitator superfamily domain-containing protein n=1 Tax=Phyllosticta capitalensis TaxID=121624 RepID=A0ABR1YA53_9PEZI